MSFLRARPPSMPATPPRTTADRARPSTGPKMLNWKAYAVAAAFGAGSGFMFFKPILAEQAAKLEAEAQKDGELELPPAEGANADLRPEEPSDGASAPRPASSTIFESLNNFWDRIGPHTI
ncbi:hypothetical protein DFJ74DRAFT_774794 [Hyaloraphidium curvatum]|nr:hypothetical protein DFJ74DRAFT_774794 [Hyaloraphidium curvatum]